MIDKLKIISLEQIIPFESYTGDRAEKIGNTINSERRLRNPLLVYPSGDNFLLLDEASLLPALGEMQITHVPVQMAETDSLSVHPWQRVVDDWRMNHLLEFCARFPRQIAFRDAPPGKPGPHQAEIRFRGNHRVRLSFSSRSFLVRADIFSKLGFEVTRHFKSFRAHLMVEDNNCLRQFPSASAAIFPPIFNINELAIMARRGVLLPPGTVRIDQPGRVLGIDYSLDILRDSASSAEKESFLRQLIQIRMSSDRTAYYNGSIFMFNN